MKLRYREFLHNEPLRTMNITHTDWFLSPRTLEVKNKTFGAKRVRKSVEVLEKSHNAVASRVHVELYLAKK